MAAIALAPHLDESGLPVPAVVGEEEFIFGDLSLRGRGLDSEGEET